LDRITSLDGVTSTRAACPPWAQDVERARWYDRRQPGHDCFLAEDGGVLAGLDIPHLPEMLDGIERREVLIFALRALSPMQQAVRLIPDGYKNEIAMANAGCRLLRGLIPALETLSGTSRADLGCDHYRYSQPTTDDIIEGLRVPLTKTEPAA
jgi:hypothetical protein